MNFWSIFMVLVLFWQSCLAQKWTNITTVNINQLVDENMSEIHLYMRRLGFDPMKMPAISDNIYVNVLGEKRPVQIDITNGFQYKASNTLERSGDFLVLLHPEGTIRLDGYVLIRELVGNFDYSLLTAGPSTMYKDQGKIMTKIQDAAVHLSFDYKLTSFQILNTQLHLEKVGNVQVHMQSSSRDNWSRSFVSNVGIPYFKKKLVEVSETTAQQVGKEAFAVLNEELPRRISNAIRQGIFKIF